MKKDQVIREFMVRVPDDLYAATRAKAAAGERSMAAVVRLLLRKWNDGEIDLAEHGHGTRA